MAASDKTHDEEKEPLEAIIEDAISCAEDGRLTLDNLLDAWGDRSYGPLFVVLGFFAGTPLAVVPAAAAVVGIVIALIAIQMALGAEHPWLPRFILDRSVSEEKARAVQDKTAPALAFLDNLITERMAWIAGPAMRRVSAVCIALLGLLMAPFDAIPFAVAAPAWAVVLFGVALTARDGLVMLLALCAMAAVLALALQVLL